MATFQKFEVLTEDMAKGVHNFYTDTLNVYLSNAAPNTATHEGKADIAEIATGNGYTGPVDTQNTASRTGGTVTIAGTDILITAAGGPIAEFQYAVFYNDTSVGDRLVGAWDYGEAVNMKDGEKFEINFPTDLLKIRPPA